MGNDINDTDEAGADKWFAALSWTLAGIVVLLVGIVIAGGWWLWQINNTPIVSTILPTNFPRHPTVQSPFRVLTSRALSAIPPQASSTPTPTPTVATGQFQNFLAATPAPGVEFARNMAMFATE